MSLLSRRFWCTHCHWYTEHAACGRFQCGRHAGHFYIQCCACEQCQPFMDARSGVNAPCTIWSHIQALLGPSAEK